MDKRQGETLKSKYAEDEIDLWKLVQVVWRYKWFIIVLFIVAVGTSIFVSKKMTPIYKVSACLQVTNSGVIKPVELTSLFKEFFKEKTPKYGIKNYPLKNAVVKNTNSGKSNLVMFTFLTAEPEKAPDLLKEEITKIVKSESQKLFSIRYKYNLKNIEEEIKAVGIKIEITEREFSKGSKRLNALENKYNILKQQEKQLKKDTEHGMLPGLILMQNEISTLKQVLYGYNINLINNRKRLKALRLAKERILNQGKEMFVWTFKPRCTKKPVKPRPLLYMAISGILAIFIGMFLAFFIEFVRKNRIK